MVRDKTKPLVHYLTQFCLLIHCNFYILTFKLKFLTQRKIEQTMRKNVFIVALLKSFFYYYITII